jgi:hypothetical protein
MLRRPSLPPVVVVPVCRRQRHRRTVYLKCTLPQEWAADAVCRVHPARNRDDARYRRVKDLFAPITEPKIAVDTDRALEDYLPTCLAAVRAFMTA